MRRGFFLALLAVGAAAACSASGGSSASPSRQADAGTTADDETNDTGDGALPDSDSGGSISKDGGSKEAAAEAAAPGDGSVYAPMDSLSDDALKKALHDLVANHTSLGYDAARDVMLGVTGTFDLQSGMLECIYTGRKVAPDGTRTPNGFNTEHTWPQSFGASTEPARSDLHHIFPVDENANNARANYPFADTDCSGASCSYDNGGSQLGPLSGGAALVWEVRPARRGDVARGMFYFAIRYEKSLDATQEAALREWNDADPPDALEQARNDAIEGYQKNRNPFVDRPDFVAHISDF